MTPQGRLAELLRTNRLAILLEIAIGFLPFWVGLVISDSTGSDRIPIGGDLVVLGGPASYVGLIISLVILWVASRARGASWEDFGLARSKRWIRAVALGLGVALAVLGTVVLIVNPIMKALPNMGSQDLSRFDYLEGDVPNLIIALVVVWITAAFLEEFLFRGYLMGRLIDLQGQQTGLAYAIAAVGQAVIFGLVHAYQGPVGMFKVGVIGLVFGLCYLAVGRSLWPLILAHGLIDSMDMVQHYLGG